MNTLETYEHVRENFVINYKDKLGETKTTAVAKNLIYNGTPITTESDVEDLVKEYIQRPEFQTKLLVESVSLVNGSIEIIGEAITVKPRSFKVNKLSTDIVDGTSKTQIEIFKNLKAFVLSMGLGELTSMIVPFKRGRVKVNETWFDYVDVHALGGTVLTDATKLVTALFNSPITTEEN